MTKRLLIDAAATAQAGADLAVILSALVEAQGGIVFLRGNLGAGKSSLVRGWLTALGVQGAMPSPTYSLVEHYVCASCYVIHMDAYRLGDAEELDYLGVTDRLGPGTLLLVEWPDQVSAALPEAALELTLEYCDAQGDVSGRPLSARLLSVLPASTAMGWSTHVAKHGAWSADQGTT